MSSISDGHTLYNGGCAGLLSRSDRVLVVVTAEASEGFVYGARGLGNRPKTRSAIREPRAHTPFVVKASEASLELRVSVPRFRKSNEGFRESSASFRESSEIPGVKGEIPRVKEEIPGVKG